MKTQIAAAAILVLVAAFASATTPQNWTTATVGLYVPPCNAQGPKHWELDVGAVVDSQVLAYDALKAAGYTTLRLRFDSGHWILGADCTIAS